MPEAFFTLQAGGQAEVTISKSRFIGFAAPCQDEEAALAFLHSVRQAHPAASHHCYAYICGANGAITRYQDDGEPSGTAGVPILESLRARQLVNAAVVVVRYFGGTLLGRGGLARAYAQAAQLVLQQSVLAQRAPSAKYLLRVPYGLWDKVQYALNHLPVRQDAAQYTDQVTVNLLMRAQDEQQVVAALQEACDARAQLQLLCRGQENWPLS